MRFVSKAEIRPMRCAVCPTIGANHSEGFIDTGAEMDACPVEQRVYVSVVAVRELMRTLGWPTPEQHTELVEKCDRLERENISLELQVREADRFAEAAEYTLGRFGQHVRNKPGRKPKVEAV
jgi:hypothetical protein